MVAIDVWLIFFFFFRQERAYDVRISDWSSDVCSSDLVGRDPRGAHRAAKPGIAILKFGRMVRRVAEEGDMPPPDLGQMRPRQLARADIVRPDGQPDAVVRNRSPAHEFRVHLDQMGRASGRARVCAYGLNSGVAGNLK